MQHIRNKYYLSNRVFVSCLFLLILNDHFLKQAFSNWLTGKLSDAAGIILLPLLIAYVFPKTNLRAVWISALAFAFWKSPFSESCITGYNSFAPITITRVVDFTDLLVLPLLVIPYHIIKQDSVLQAIRVTAIHPLLVLLPAVLALMATSPGPRYYYRITDGNWSCSNCNMTVNFSQHEIIEKAKKHNIAMELYHPVDILGIFGYAKDFDSSVRFYRVKQLIIEGDTLRNLDFSLRTLKSGKTKFYFNGMQVSERMNFDSRYRKWRKHYRKLLFSEIKSSLKHRN